MKSLVQLARIVSRTGLLRRWKNAESLYWHAQSIETLLPNGKRNPAAGIMLALLAEMARNESETLRERIKSGLALARSRGVILRRPKDTNIVVTISFPCHSPSRE